MTYEDLGVFNNKCTIKYRIYIEKLLSTFAILVKKINLHSKFDMHPNHTYKPFLIVWKKIIWKIKYKFVLLQNNWCQSFDLNWWDHITLHLLCFSKCFCVWFVCCIFAHPSFKLSIVYVVCAHVVLSNTNLELSNSCCCDD